MRTVWYVQSSVYIFFFFFQAEDGIRDYKVTGVQTCALPISAAPGCPGWAERAGARRETPRAAAGPAATRRRAGRSSAGAGRTVEWRKHRPPAAGGPLARSVGGTTTHTPRTRCRPLRERRTARRTRARRRGCGRACVGGSLRRLYSSSRRSGCGHASQLRCTLPFTPPVQAEAERFRARVPTLAQEARVS